MAALPGEPSAETDAIEHARYWKERTRESVQLAMAAPLTENETATSRRQLAMHTAAHACILEADITGFSVDIAHIKQFVQDMHTDFTADRVEVFLEDAINAGILLKKMARDGRFVLEVAEDVYNNRQVKIVDTYSKLRCIIRAILNHARYAMSRPEIQQWATGTYDLQLENYEYWFNRGLHRLLEKKQVVMVYGNLYVHSCIDLWLRSIRGCCLCDTLAQTINVKMATLKVEKNGKELEQLVTDASFGYVGEDVELIVDGVMERLDAIEPAKNNTIGGNMLVRSNKDARIKREPIITLSQLKEMNARPRYVAAQKNEQCERTKKSKEHDAAKAEKAKAKAEKPGDDNVEDIDKLLQMVESEQNIMKNCKALVNTLKARVYTGIDHIKYVREALEQRMANINNAKEDMDLD